MDTPVFPFTTRKMLSFEGSAQFALQVSSQDSFGVPITVTGATKDGVFTFKHEADGSGAPVVATYGLPDIPIWISVTQNPEVTSGFSTFVKVALQINSNNLYQLCSGYIQNNRDLTWPMATNEGSHPINGIHSVSGFSDPDAGAQIAVEVPDNFFWKVRSVRFSLVTDANAATRQVYLVIKDPSGTDVVAKIPASTTQTAGLTRQYNWLPGVTAGNAGTNIVTQIPADLLLREGQIIATEMDNAQVGDNFGTPMITREEYYTVNVP